MEIEIIDWVIVGLLVFALFGLNTAVSAVMDIREGKIRNKLRQT